MQDTTQDAFKILENLFDKEKVTVQYIGDRNQNLYNGTDKWYLSSKENPKLNISNRFGKNIANFLNCIKENSEDNLIKGNSNIEDYKPILFLYDSLDKNEEEGNNKILLLTSKCNLSCKKVLPNIKYSVLSVVYSLIGISNFC